MYGRAGWHLAAAVVTGGLVWVTVSLGPTTPPRWTITHRVAAHRALVVEVETRYPEEAMTIAREIVEPERARFGEVLVFINPRGRREMLRRVQWTAERGYEETVYKAEGRRQK